MAEQQQVSAYRDATREVPTLRRQSLVREVNAQIQRLSDGHDDEEMLVLLCECGDSECMRRLTISRKEYESVRSAPTRFVLTTEHWAGDAVVGGHDGYVVVELGVRSRS